MNKKFSVRNVDRILELLRFGRRVWHGCARPARASPGGRLPMPAPLAADMKGKTADQFYKKIEVLKGIPADQVHPAMEYITTALGVGCGYCHVIGHLIPMTNARNTWRAA